MPDLQSIMHELQWILLDITSNSGKVLFACVRCGHVTPAPDKTHVCRPEAISLQYGPFPDSGNLQPFR